MSSNNPDYVHYYNNTLLDDLHNNFPALLYDHGRFQNIQQIFSYIRNEMNNRYNLYSNAVNSYRSRTFHPPTPIISFQNPHPIVTPPPEDISQTELHTANFLLSLLGGNIINNIANPSTRVEGSSATMPRLSTRIIQSPQDRWASFRQPVVVRPSNEVLQQNTEIMNGLDVGQGNTCSVCQDSIIATDSCRRLNSCQHIFHRTCIDEWFERSVYCPVCRHDVRNTMISTNNNSLNLP
jgi:hypothetical protein